MDAMFFVEAGFAGCFILGGLLGYVLGEIVKKLANEREY